MQTVEYRPVYACVRPPRIAVVYSAGSTWVPEARGAIGDLSDVWGGLGGVLIPVNESGQVNPVLLSLLKLHDPDYIFMSSSCSLNVEAKESLAKQIDQWCSPFTGYDLGEQTYSSAELRTFNSDSRWKGSEPRDCFVPDLSRMDESVALMVETRIGSLTDHADPRFNVITLPVPESAAVSMVNLAITGKFHSEAWDLRAAYLQSGSTTTEEPFTALGEDKFLSHTPFALSNSDLKKFGTTPRAPTVCVIGDSADDHAAALLCDRIFRHAAWVPQTLVNDDSSLKTVVRNALYRLASKSDELSLMSVSESSLSLQELAPLFDGPVITERDGSVANQREVVHLATWDKLVSASGRRFLADKNQNQVSQTLPCHTARDELSILTPVPAPMPTAATALLAAGQSWCIDVWQPEFSLPARTAITSAALSRQPLGGWPETVVRAARHGVSYSSEKAAFFGNSSSIHSIAKPHLSFPSAESIFRELALKNGASVQISPAGKIAAAAADLWGSHQALARNLGGNVRKILDSFVAAPQETGDYKCGYSIRGVGYLDIEYAARVVEGDEEIIRGVLDDLIQLKALRRGLILHCKRCQTPDFYALASITDDGFACILCGHISQIERSRWDKKKIEPEWYYSLDPVVRKLLKDDGDVPLLGIEKLRKNKRSILWSPELLLTLQNSKIEIDIAAIIDGRIVVGEAKSNSELKDGKQSATAAAKKLVRAAIVLDADEIVLATAKPQWGSEVRSSVESAVERLWTSGPRPLVTELVGLRDFETKDMID